MMLQLYPANQANFERNGDTIHGAYDAYVIRDEVYYLKFKIIISDYQHYKRVKRGMIIGAMTPGGRDFFRVQDVKKYADYVQFECYHVLYDLRSKLVGKIGINRGTLVSALGQFTQSLKSQVPHRFLTDITKQRTFNTDKDNKGAFNALEIFMGGKHSIVGTWECELALSGFDIRLVESLGRKTQALLYEHKNIAEFEDVESDESLCTRIYARSEFTEEGQQEATVIEVVVDSPLIAAYHQVYEKQYENNSMKTEKDLRDWAMRKFSKDNIDKPKRSIKIKTNIVDNTEINYGDTLVLRYLTHDVDDEIRCVGYEYDPVNELFYEITLGSTVRSLSQVIGHEAEQKTDGMIQSLNRQYDEKWRTMMGSDGNKTVTWGPNPPKYVKEGDKWFYFEDDRPNDVTVREYKNGEWVDVVGDYFSEVNKEKFKEINNRTNQLGTQIQTTNTQVEAISRKATGAENAAERAKSIAEATKLSVTNRLSNLRSDVHEILQANFDRLKGQSSYLHVAYASDVSGSRVTGFSKTDTTGKRFVGTQSTSSATASDNPNDYMWVKLPQGEPGRDGVALTNILKDSYTLKSLHYIGLSPNTPDKKVEVLTEDTGEKFVRLTVRGLRNREYFGVAFHLYVDSLAQGDKLSYNIQYREQPTIVPIDQGVAFEVKRFRHPRVWVTSHVNFPRTNNSEWHTLKGTVNINNSANRLTHSFYVYLRQNGCVDIKLPMLVKGDKVPEDYSANPADAILEMSTFSANYERDNQRVRENLQELQRKFNSNGELTSLAEFKRQYEATARGVSEQLSAHDRSISGTTNTITNLNREMNAVKGNLETKVNQSEYNQLNGRVTTAESSIRQTATELAKKISRSDFDPVNQKVTTLYNDTKETVEAFKRVLGSDESTVRGNVSKLVHVENLVKNSRFEFGLTGWTLSNLDKNSFTFDERPTDTDVKHVGARIRRSGGVQPHASVYQRIFLDDTPRGTKVRVGASISTAMSYRFNTKVSFDLWWYKNGRYVGRSRSRSFSADEVSSTRCTWVEEEFTIPADCNTMSLSVEVNQDEEMNETDWFITNVTFAVTDLPLRGWIRPSFDTELSAVEQTKEYIRTELFKTTGSDSGTTSLRTFIEHVAGRKTERYTKQEVENRINASKSAIEQSIRGQFQHVESDHAKLERLFGTTQNGEITHLARQLVTNEIFTTEIKNATPRNLVSDGYVDMSSNAYGFGTRKVILEQRKQYTLTVCGKVTGTARGKKLRVWIYRTNDWDGERYSVDITSTTQNVAHVVFTARSTGEYTIVSTLAPENGSREGTADLLWYVVTEGTHTPKSYINNDESMASKVHQMSNSWGVNIQSANDVITSLNANASGVKIKGKFIELDGDVSMSSAFADSLLTQTFSTNSLTAFSAKIANLVVANADFKGLTAQKARFIEAMFDGNDSRLTLTSEQMKFTGPQKTYKAWSFLENREKDFDIPVASTVFDADGMDFELGGVKIGALEYRDNSSTTGKLADRYLVGFVPERIAAFTIGYKKTEETKTATRTFSVDGATGDIYLTGTIYGGEGDTVGLNIGNIEFRGTKYAFLGHAESSTGLMMGNGVIWIIKNNTIVKQF